MPPVRALLLSLALLPALAAGCGGPAAPADPGRTSDLLSRPPSASVTTDARLRPATFDQWGRRDAGGWAGHTGVDAADQRPWVGIAGERAGLYLESVGPVDRELELVVRARRPGTRLQLVLNEVQLEVVEAGPEAATLRVEVPAAFWRRGRNLLELVPPAVDGEPEVWVSELGLEPAESLTASDDGLGLDVGTEALWQVETSSSGLVEVELRAPRGEGQAILTLESLDPATGVVEVVEERGFELLAASPPERQRLLLPEGSDRVHQLRLGWDGVPGSRLEVAHLELYEETPVERPPILFISIDTLSAQNMSIYGYERETTPNLERFVRDAVVFDVARANAPWTIPSYASQFTGLYAHSNKNETASEDGPGPAWQQFTIHDDRWTLVEMLKAAGYTTAGIVDNLWLTRVPGFAQGFDHFDAEPALLGHGDLEGGMRMVMPRAADFLERHRDVPTFVFAQVVDVHGPYNPDDDHRGAFEDALEGQDLTELPVVRTSPTAFGGIPSVVVPDHGDAPLPATVAAERVQAHYDEKVLELDTVLGAFFDRLRAEGLYDDLLIIVSADHGESMVDHDFYFRHGIVYDSAIHVPLVVKLPGQDQAGRRISTPVQLVDLYPTLADVLGLGSGRDHLHGRSLLPAMLGAPLEDAPILSQADIMEHCSVSLGRWKLLVAVPKKTAIDTLLTSPKFQRSLHERVPEQFEEIFGAPPPVDPNRVIETLAVLREENSLRAWQVNKQVRSLDPIVELYDTLADPQELHDLSAERPDVVDQLVDLMRDERARAQAMHLVEGTERVRVNAAMLEELERLGYVGQD